MEGAVTRMRMKDKDYTKNKNQSRVCVSSENKPSEKSVCLKKLESKGGGKQGTDSLRYKMPGTTGDVIKIDRERRLFSFPEKYSFTLVSPET